MFEACSEGGTPPRDRRHLNLLRHRRRDHALRLDHLRALDDRLWWSSPDKFLADDHSFCALACAISVPEESDGRSRLIAKCAPDSEDMTVDFLTGIEIGAGVGVGLWAIDAVRRNLAEVRSYRHANREAKRRAKALVANLAKPTNKQERATQKAYRSIYEAALAAWLYDPSNAGQKQIADQAAAKLAEPTRVAELNASRVAWRAEYDRLVAAYHALPIPDKIVFKRRAIERRTADRAANPLLHDAVPRLEAELRELELEAAASDAASAATRRGAELSDELDTYVGLWREAGSDPNWSPVRPPKTEKHCGLRV